MSKYLEINIIHHISIIVFDSKTRNKSFMFIGVLENKFWYYTVIEKEIYQ